MMCTLGITIPDENGNVFLGEKCPSEGQIFADMSKLIVGPIPAA